MVIAVTGSKGFVGSNLLTKIIDRHKIIEIDINDGFDISDKQCIEKIEKFDVIVHLAGRSFVPNSYLNSLEFYHTNINSTLNILELCKIYNARFIYVSSYVYGEPEYLPIDENHPLKPFNPYSQSKIISEELAFAYCRDFDLSGIILRPFNLFGYNQNSNFLIPSILDQIKYGQINLTDPRPKRDYLYIDDFCEFLVKCFEYRKNEVEVFNVGSGISHSILEIIRIIKTILNIKNLDIKFSENYRKNEILDVRADITKARNLLNWTPKYDIYHGLKFYLNKYFNLKNGI